MTERMEGAVDFHVHYNPKDESTAYRAIDEASRQGVRAMTLLARSEISDNLPNFMEYADKKGIELVSGVEYWVTLENGKTDLICLGFDYEDPGIKRLFGRKEGLEQNAELAKQQKQFLEKHGYQFQDLSAEDEAVFQLLIEGNISEKAINFCQIAAHVPQNKQLIEQAKLEDPKSWQEIQEALKDRPDYMEDPSKLDAKFLWQKYFAAGKEGFIPVQKDAKDLINVIHNAGGVVLYSPEGNFNQELWNELQTLKIDGIMAWHGGNLGGGREQKDIPRKVIEDVVRHEKLVLGGSDYMGGDWQVGVGRGDLFINPRRFEELKNYISLRNHGRLPWRKELEMRENR